jgi:hypothetical protein
VKTPGWEGRLIEALRTIAATPFDPGSLDCGLAFGTLVEAMTGTDPAAPLRGRYKTLAGASRRLKKMGFDDHIEYVASLYEELPSPLYAQRGDGAAVRDDDGFPALGIVQGENIYVMRPDGMGVVKLTEAYRAFRI